MIFPAPLAKSLLMAASIGMVVPVLAQTPKQARPNRTAAKTPPATPAEAPEVQGIERAWAQGILGLAVEGNSLVLRFYDAQRLPVAAGAARATARWDPVNKAGQQRTVLNPGPEGQSLRSPAVVRPPHVFVVYVTLLDEAGNGLGMVAFDLLEAAKSDR